MSDFFPYWGYEVDLLELGNRFTNVSDEATSVEHRLCRANGLEYGCPPRHWAWAAEKGRKWAA